MGRLRPWNRPFWWHGPGEIEGSEGALYCDLTLRGLGKNLEGMPALRNCRQEQFAQLVASGKHSDMEAFKQAGYADESAHKSACRLRANESVAARIEELRARNAEKCQLSRDEAVQYLVEILKTPIAEVTADHRLAQSYDAKSGKIELPNKLGAMQLLAKMCGWNEPEKHEIEHGFKEKQELIEVIARLRGRGAVRNNQCAG